MRIKFWIFIVCILLCGSARSQVAEEVQKLENIVSNYFDKSRDLFELEAIGKRGGPPEAFFVILEIDSVGSVEKVHLFSENIKDSGYAILKNLNPKNFESWKEEKYKGKTIFIPVIVLSRDGKPNYVLYLADMTTQRKEVRKLVIGKTVILSWPYIIRD